MSQKFTYICGFGRWGSRTRSKVSFGCGTKSGHIDGTRCASYCGAYQMMKYPWSRRGEKGV